MHDELNTFLKEEQRIRGVMSEHQNRLRALDNAQDTIREPLERSLVANITRRANTGGGVEFRAELGFSEYPEEVRELMEGDLWSASIHEAGHCIANIDTGGDINYVIKAEAQV